MRINRTVETEEGSVVFQRVLEGKSLDLVIEVGLTTLMNNGALPFISINAASVMDAPELDQ